jgi:predicted HTH domain antitoxin
MQVTIEIPDTVAANLWNGSDPSRAILEMAVIEAYRSERIGAGEVMTTLGIESRLALEAFFKERGVPLHYDGDDLEEDLETLRTLGQK